MADARKFVLPGQPPGTSRRRPSPLLPGLGWFFSLFPRAREHGEFDGFFFSFSGSLVCYGYGCVFVSRPCLVHPEIQKVFKIPVTSNLAAHA